MTNGFKTRERLSGLSFRFKEGQDVRGREEESIALLEDQRLGVNQAESPRRRCRLRNFDPSCRNSVVCWSIILGRAAVSIDGWSALLGAGDILK
jgi:hypothetical protein